MFDSLCVGHFLSLSLIFSFSLSLYLSLCLCLCLSHSFSLSLFLSVSLTHFLSLSHAHTHMRTLFLIPPVPLCFKTRHGCDSSCHCLERNRPGDGSIRRHQWYVHILFLNCIQTSRELTPFLQCLNRFLFCSHVVYFLLEVFN